MKMVNSMFFINLPYVAICVFFLGVIYKYRNLEFQYSSLSSQFLENRKLFLGTLLFHIGILIVLMIHVIAFLFPNLLLLWNSNIIRLMIVEGIGIVFGLSAFFGMVNLLRRRIFDDRIKVVSNKMDFFIEALLLIQIILGIWIAIYYRWGSSWFASGLSPYLWSIVMLKPNVDVVLALPIIIQFHIIGAFLIILIFPFTRLVHILVAPFHYIFRPYQQVIWNWNKKNINNSTIWSYTRPYNN